MKAKAKDLISRLTGVSGPGFGFQWANSPSQREIVEELFDRLSDRRVLYNPYMAECQDHCVQSVIEIRGIITELLAKLRGENDANAHLRAIRASCREFLDNSTNRGWGYVGFGHDMEFFSALGELRARVGVQIALLAAATDLKIPSELERILPPIVEGENDA